MKIIEALKYILGITIACLGWFIASTVTRINTKLDLLLEDKAAKTEQIRALERATFGKVTEPEDNAFNGKQKHHFFNMIFDKNKTLQYKNQEFIYI